MIGCVSGNLFSGCGGPAETTGCRPGNANSRNTSKTTTVSLADELLVQPDADEPKHTPYTVFDGESGYIQTGSFPAEQVPTFDSILTQFGYNPAEVRIVGNPRVSRWQQRARKREWSDKHQAHIQTGEFETIWLCAYKFGIEPRTWSVDLPALYNEVEKSKAQKRFDPKTGDATVVVCWADIQTGKVDHLGGLPELLERLDEKRDNLNAYLKRQSFDHIVIADCGDIIEGFQNFDAQTRTNALSIMDQVDVAATEFWKLIKTCSAVAPVDVLSIPSNHCRWAKGKSLIGKTTDDWGLHVSKRLERHNEEIGLPVQFHRAEEWMETLEFDVRNSRIGLAHGHQANNPNQVPAWWGKMTHAGVLSCDVLVTGHFHYPSLRPSGKTAEGRSKWHVQASTLDNGSSWVRNKYGEDGDPALTVFQINDDGFDVTSFALL